MNKPFRTAPLDLLAGWLFKELERGSTVMGIPVQNFQVPSARMASTLFGHGVAAPLGVAAGPHSQLAQNIVASWLCGARFIELKTVQILDELEVSKPCIDALDEGYNCEWSQELKLEESFQEYLHAWVLLHALAHRLGLPGPGTHFNMSVGYDLAGIRSPRVRAFIAAMRAPGAALDAAVEQVAKVYPAVRDLAIPGEISNHVTLSTMHGCPPAEIERIATFLLTEVGVHTWVKLNPTLLGPERLRGLLNGSQGFAIEVPDSAFEHDPGFPETMTMVGHLATVARDAGREFGLKLTNTLEVLNQRPVLPSGEKVMYLSGRALHPLTVSLAHLICEAQEGKVALSFCGGANAANFPDLVGDGLGPVTVCTDLLKPGGYARLQQYLVHLEAAMVRIGAENLDDFVRLSSGGHGARFNLARHAVKVTGDEAYARRPRPLEFKGERPLGSFDCIFAPCVDACPTHQNIPDYLWLVAHGQPRAAMEVILRTNPQPGITGSVCDHPCTERCVRMFYDAPLAIREIKRFAFEHGGLHPERPGPSLHVGVAVVGAGPAGLSAAYYLAKRGFQVEVFEAKQELGGMVSGVIPGFRLSSEAMAGDMNRLEELGVRFHFGAVLGRDLSLEQLRRDHPYVFLGVGAPRGKRLGIPAEGSTGVIDALVFLDRVQAGTPMDLGRRVLIIGAGNTAMNAARSARRLVREGEVTLVYRRTRAEMPADPEEVLDCLAEGVALRDLLAPTEVIVDGGRVTGLACVRMRLGERDRSGRPRPVPVPGGAEFLPADTIIPAISQEPVLDFLSGLDLARNPDDTLVVDPATRETALPGLFAGGDVVHGPLSIIQAIADGRAVAETIAARHGQSIDPEPMLEKRVSPEALLEKKARLALAQQVPVLPLEQRTGFEEVLLAFTPEAASREAARCLDCDELCSLCVTVCPNRSNLAYGMAPFHLDLPILVQRGGTLVPEGSRPFRVEQTVQTFNVADFCNECGNCTTFCPTAGAPYKDKPRFWIDRDGYREAKGDVFRMERGPAGLLMEARLGGRECRLEVGAEETRYRSGPFQARLRSGSWELLSWEVAGKLAEGTQVDLAPCATMLVLLHAESALPDLVPSPTPA